MFAFLLVYKTNPFISVLFDSKPPLVKIISYDAQFKDLAICSLAISIFFLIS